MGQTGTLAGRRVRPPGRLRSIWQSRSVLRLLVQRELKVRYGKSALGYVWTILDPLLTCLVFGLVFGLLLPRESLDDPYLVFLIAGVLPWTAMSGSISAGARALKSESKLVRSTNIPRELWVLKVVGAKLVEFLLSLPVLFAFMLVMGKGFDLGNLYMFPIALVMTAFLLVGTGMLFAPLVVMYPDLMRLIKIGMRLLFYASGILYNPSILLDQLPEQWRWTFYLNPFAGAIELFRATIFGATFPGWGLIGVSAGVIAVIFTVGTVVFRRLEGAVLKEI